MSLRGIGGEQNLVGGRGPLVIATRGEDGSIMYMIDPSGVYLDKSSSSQLRILGQQRMKKFGFNLVQNKDGDGKDYLVHQSRGPKKHQRTLIPLITQNGILMLMTTRVDFNAH